LDKKTIFNIYSKRVIDLPNDLGFTGWKYNNILLPFLIVYIALWFTLEIIGPKACNASVRKSGGRLFQAKDGWAGEMRAFGKSLKHYTPWQKTIVCSRVKLSHICLIFWTCLVLVGGRSLAEVNVVDMNGLFNTVSNYPHTSNIGNSIMANGNLVILAVRSYKCSQGTCATSTIMLYTYNLNGEVKCVEDNASCVLDGENERGGMSVDGTGSGTLILRALTFDKGYADGGGGVFIYGGAIVDLELLVFSNNRATDSTYGGGAIYVWGGIINIYSTTFNGNTADSGNGDDIRNNGGTITIHNTCPSPYSSNTPIQGKTRMRIV
jgi:predicted outer membrane repeat protein